MRRFRPECGLTQEQAAERAALAPRHWQKLEAGAVNATLDTLVRVAVALGTDVGALLSEDGSHQGRL